MIPASVDPHRHSISIIWLAKNCLHCIVTKLEQQDTSKKTHPYIDAAQEGQFKSAFQGVKLCKFLWSLAPKETDYLVIIEINSWKGYFA